MLIDVLLLSFSYTYEVYISQHDNMSTYETYTVARPPLYVHSLPEGVRMYVCVSLRDAHGYLSPHSHTLRFIKRIGTYVYVREDLCTYV